MLVASDVAMKSANLPWMTLYLTTCSAQAEESLFEMFEDNIATKRVKYLQSVSFGK